MRRVAVMGGSCVGKTTVAKRLAAALQLPHIELDALHHDRGWQEASAEVLQERVRAAFDAAPDGWVVDGNYRTKLGSLVLERADTVVHLEPPFRVAFGRALRRTIVRTITREELWNGNREQLRHLFTRYWIPWWVLQTHRHYGREIPERVAEHPHLDLVQLRSADEVEEWLQSIQPTASMSGSSKESARQKTPPLAET
ncbi:MAG: shikimate kinase [Gaiellaceae bacterium]